MFESILPLIPSLSLIFLYLAILVAIAEGLHRFRKIDVELTRKIVHIGSGQVILFAWLWHIPLNICLWASILAGIMALISYFLPILPSIESVGRKSLGTFCYAVSIGILCNWFWLIDQPQYAVIGILIMAWGDGMAGIIGKNYGKNFYLIIGNKKSWEGSLTMTVISFVVTSLILLVTIGFDLKIWFIAVMVGLVAAVLESYSTFGVDNFTVPLGSAAACFYLTNWLF